MHELHGLKDAADQLRKPSHFLTVVPAPTSTLLSVPPPPDPLTSTFILSTEDPLIQQLAAEMQIKQEEDLQEKENGVNPEIQVVFEPTIKLISTEKMPGDLGGLVNKNKVPTSIADLEAPPPADVEFTVAEICSFFIGVILQPVFLQSAL